MPTLIISPEKQYSLSELALAVELNDSDRVYLEQEIDGKKVSIAVDRATFLAGLIPQGKEIISGGATYSGVGMIFNVSNIVYRYAGSIGETLAVDAILADGGVEPRIDAIVVNAEFNTIEIIQGIEDANPATPVIGEEQILVQYIFVSAGATTPGITENPVYKEDVEWISSTNGTVTGSIDFTSAVDPYEGAVCTFVDQCDKRAKIRFTNPTPVDFEQYTIVSVFVRFPVPLAANKKLYVNVRNAGAAVGNTVNLMTLGLNRNSLDWQQIVIPTSAFNTTEINEFQLRMVGGSNNDNASWNIDNLILFTGFAPPTSIPTIRILDNDSLVGATSDLNFENSPTLEVNTSVAVDGKINVSFTVIGGGGGAVETVVGTINEIDVDSADPENPVVSLSATVKNQILDNATDISDNTDRIEDLEADVVEIESTYVKNDASVDIVGNQKSTHFTAKTFQVDGVNIIPFSATPGWNWLDGDFSQFTASANAAFIDPTNIHNGVKILYLVQDPTGGWEITFSAIYNTAGLLLNTAADAINILSFVFNSELNRIDVVNLNPPIVSAIPIEYTFTLNAPVLDEVLVILPKAKVAGIITNLVGQTDTGTMDLRLSINAAEVGSGVSAITSVESDTVFSVDNIWAATERITLKLSNFTGSPTQIIVSVQVSQSVQ